LTALRYVEGSRSTAEALGFFQAHVPFAPAMLWHDGTLVMYFTVAPKKE
jgi:hypothetical protein